jgi:hypothetical protein
MATRGIFLIRKDPRVFFGAFPFIEKQDAYRDL